MKSCNYDRLSGKREVQVGKYVTTTHWTFRTSHLFGYVHLQMDFAHWRDWERAIDVVNQTQGTGTGGEFLNYIDSVIRDIQGLCPGIVPEPHRKELRKA